MTESLDRQPDGAQESGLARAREAFAGQPAWKKVGLVLSLVFILVGTALWAVEGPAEPVAVGLKASGSSPGGAGLVPGGAGLVPAGTEVPEAGDGENWSPVFLRFGFSFFVGFAIGAAARTVLRIVLLFVGLFLVSQFVLAEFEFVEVHWDRMGAEFDGLLARIGEEATSVKGLFTGRLPSAGLALLGLYAGFRRG